MYLVEHCARKYALIRSPMGIRAGLREHLAPMDRPDKIPIGDRGGFRVLFANRVKYFGFVILDIVFLGMVLAFTLVAFKEGSRRTFTGVLCATFTTMMYVAPLAALSTTMKTKSVEHMPILLVFFLFLNGCVWFTFALLVTDTFVHGAKCIRNIVRSNTIHSFSDTQKLDTSCHERDGKANR
ncbi:bidirectional sugar transporter SWEET16-like protein [Tanacetum coccineum]